MTRYYNKRRWSKGKRSFSRSFPLNSCNDPGQQGSSSSLLFRNPGSLLLCTDIVRVIKSDGFQTVGREKSVDEAQLCLKTQALINAPFTSVNILLFSC